MIVVTGSPCDYKANGILFGSESQVKPSLLTVTVFLVIINTTECRCVQNYKENRNCDHIAFNMKVIIKIFLPV